MLPACERYDITIYRTPNDDGDEGGFFEGLSETLKFP